MSHNDNGYFIGIKYKTSLEKALKDYVLLRMNCPETSIFRSQNKKSMKENSTEPGRRDGW